MLRRYLQRTAVLLALSVFTAGPIFALTWAQIRTEIRLRIKDVSSTRQRFSDTQLLNIGNEGQRDIINATWAVSKSTSITLVAGTAYYNLPSDFIAFSRVTRDYGNLPEVTLLQKDVDTNNDDWEADTGAAVYYFQDKAQSGKIGITPVPSSGNVGTLRIVYYALVSDLSADSDTPYNAEARYTSYHDLLIYHACFTVFLVEGDFDKAKSYQMLYDTRLRTMNENVGVKPLVTNVPPTVNGGNP